MQKETIEGFRLSPQQKHLWLLQQMEQELPYRVQCAVLVEGNIDRKILKKALQNTVSRHEILRTTFRCLPGMTLPLQVIAGSGQISVREHDLSDLSPEEREIQTESLFQELSQHWRDIDPGAVLHVSSVTLSPEKHILIAGLSALNADRATLRNLLREISRSYSACLRGEQLSDESMQYADIAEWQNQLLEAEDTERGKEYWRKLDIARSARNLPFEKREPANPGFQPQVLNVRIGRDSLERIERVAQKYQRETSGFLLACWLLLLCRLTGETDMIAGMAGDGRKYEELEDALGLLSKYLPVQCHLEENLTFAELWERVSESAGEACKWQEYFTWDEFKGAGEAGQCLSFFPACFEFERGGQKYCSGGVSFSLAKQYACTDRFKLKLACIQEGDSLIAEFYWDSSLFETSDIQRLAEHFQALLDSAAGSPDGAVSELQILSERARHQLIVEFNRTQQYFPTDRLAHQLFESHAELTPDSIAAVFENQQLTYRSLNERANQLAHYLQQLGVKPEVTVGICAERSLDAIVGILGILKAGGAYLPLEPAMPAERLELMLRDAGVPVLLTQQHLAGNFAGKVERVVCLDADRDEIAKASNQNFPSEAGAENLAYVIYTSGSTGTPKGVAVEHRQLLNYLHAIQHILDAPGASFATVSTFAADLGHTAIFPALCGGGCLHIISQERATDPEALAEYFRRHPIDCLKIVPSHLKALLAQTAAVLPSKRLILGGEALSWELVENVRECAPDCVIFNHYGPTETTVGALTYQVERGKVRRDCQTVPLGRPISNAQIYILDSHRQPVPAGAAGELYIGGAGVARGYLNRPELTAEKFIANPFAGATGEARLYKTGDLARYLPDGNIEFLGRTDSQVKIRGFRIELGEIEAALRQHPDAEQAAVIAREDATGEKRLAAYIVAKQQAINPQSSNSQMSEIQIDWRSFLKGKLPDYMVPSAFVTLKSLPLTPNGKIDRQALPAPETARADLAGAFVAPRTNLEEAIAGIWAEVLNLERVGAGDNFFELGGHSLLATQVISRLRQTFEIELPLHHLFERPTVAELAALIAEKIAEREPDEQLAEILAKLEQLSQEEVQEILANEGASK